MLEFIRPAWPAPANVHALVTTRKGGVSAAPYASLNLADHVGDDPAAVAENRARLRHYLPSEPIWLRQVHGTQCVDAAAAAPGSEADAAFARQRNTVCAVLTADCLPVLLCDEAGTVVAAAHAGWRGLAAGVLERTVAALKVPGKQLLAWLGPAIGPQNFEVGDEVRAAFVAHDAAAARAFVARPQGKWLCNLYLLARQRLAAIGVERVFIVEPDAKDASHVCTLGDTARFFSYRRDGPTGRMASLIWLS